MMCTPALNACYPVPKQLLTHSLRFNGFTILLRSLIRVPPNWRNLILAKASQQQTICWAVFSSSATDFYVQTVQWCTNLYMCLCSLQCPTQRPQNFVFFSGYKIS